MLIKKICVKWFTWMLKASKKTFNLINWVLVLVKDFWTLKPKNQFYKTLN